MNIPNDATMDASAFEGANQSNDASHVRKRQAKKKIDLDDSTAPTKKKGWQIVSETSKTEPTPIPELTEEVTKQYNLDDDDDDDNETSGTAIPTLEQEKTEAMQLQTADAPEQSTSYVQSLTELDKDVFVLPALSSEKGIDLSILTDALSIPSQLVERDEEWTDRHFRDILNEQNEQENQKK
mmetsp:Transcript_14283/g.21592  ORF Transcript_14283/g.21592 Transcript_14283/m.21592 type:complete len:182 (+) Transcript_14283:12-557(+)